MIIISPHRLPGLYELCFLRFAWAVHLQSVEATGANTLLSPRRHEIPIKAIHLRFPPPYGGRARGKVAASLELREAVTLEFGANFGAEHHHTRRVLLGALLN